MGDYLKPSKCFYHLITFLWRPDGSWVYVNEDQEDLQLEIPLPGSLFALIEHCGVEATHKTLGVMTFPSGDHSTTFPTVKEKAQGWIDWAVSAKLAHWNLCFLTDRQFWPKVRFGIGLNVAPYLVLSKCLMRQYYELVPLGGICWLANRIVRQLDGVFYGVGCPCPAIECLAAQSTKVIIH